MRIKESVKIPFVGGYVEIFTNEVPTYNKHGHIWVVDFIGKIISSDSESRMLGAAILRDNGFENRSTDFRKSVVVTPLDEGR